MAIPFVMIELDKPRKMRFGMNSVLMFEQLTGKPVKALDDELSFETTCQILWVMLLQDDPALTLKATCDLVDEYADNLTQVSGAITRAMEAGVLAKKDKSPNVKAPTATK